MNELVRLKTHEPPSTNPVLTYFQVEKDSVWVVKNTINQEKYQVRPTVYTKHALKAARDWSVFIYDPHFVEVQPNAPVVSFTFMGSMWGIRVDADHYYLENTMREFTNRTVFANKVGKRIWLMAPSMGRKYVMGIHQFVIIDCTQDSPQVRKEIPPFIPSSLSRWHRVGVLRKKIDEYVEALK